ncbi:hypothetical protein [Oceanobacillus limi]|nr:hypothetical protein [Oceanobacillus limi]
MKNKRWIFAVIFLFIFLVIVLLINQWSTTTYEEVINNLFSEDEDISEIYILYLNTVNNEEKEMRLTNNDEITKLIEQPLKIKFKRKRELFNSIYFMIIKTNKTRYTINIQDNNHLNIDGKYYEILGRNKLIDVIESNGVKWEQTDL